MKLGNFDLTNTQYSNIPERLIVALEKFLRHGIKPGSFLTAVLNNDLYEAFSRADSESLEHLHELVILISCHFPGRFLKAGSVDEFIEGTIRYAFTASGYAEWIETNPEKACYIEESKLASLGIN